MVFIKARILGDLQVLPGNVNNFKVLKKSVPISAIKEKFGRYYARVVSPKVYAPHNFEHKDGVWVSFNKKDNLSCRLPVAKEGQTIELEY